MWESLIIAQGRKVLGAMVLSVSCGGVSFHSLPYLLRAACIGWLFVGCVFILFTPNK